MTRQTAHRASSLAALALALASIVASMIAHGMPTFETLPKLEKASHSLQDFETTSAKFETSPVKILATCWKLRQLLPKTSAKRRR